MDVNNLRIGIASLLHYSTAGTSFSHKLFLTIPRMEPVQSNTWLDEMKSSSPTHKNRNKDHSIDHISNENDDLYYNWTFQIFNHSTGCQICPTIDGRQLTTIDDWTSSSSSAAASSGQVDRWTTAAETSGLRPPSGNLSLPTVTHLDRRSTVSIRRMHAPPTHQICRLCLLLPLIPSSYFYHPAFATTINFSPIIS
nr:trehalose-phosphate phosphatase A-like isoform X1 [Ipomoea trifida]